MTLTTTASTLSNSRRRTLLRLAVLAAVAFAAVFISAQPAHALYDEGTQLPGTVQIPDNRDGSVKTGGHRCGSYSDPLAPGGGPVLWRKEANGRWRVEIIDYPGCTKKMTVVVDPSTNQKETFDITNRRWGNSGQSMYCLKYVEVLRFYGPSSNPAANVTRSIVRPTDPCAGTSGYRGGSPTRLGLFTPHPHDAHINPTNPIYKSTGTYSTTEPLSTAWQPRGVNASGHRCPQPDDPSNLRRFFQNTGDEAQDNLARGFRQGIAEAFFKLRSKTRQAGLPDSMALQLLNATKVTRYTSLGDTFDTVQYSDGVPCSSPLDFTVPAGREPWVYGMCVAPVVTAYRGPFWVEWFEETRNGSTVTRTRHVSYGVYEAFPDAWDTLPSRIPKGAYGRHLPDYVVEGASNYFGGIVPAPRDRVVDAYRAEAAKILGRTDQFQYIYNPNVVGRASQMAANLPCYYGTGPVEPEQVIIEDREPVDPILISGPDSALAYVGGVRTAQTFVFSPDMNLTCNGGQPCTQGQTITRVDYTPEVRVPSGWTQCTTSNRGTCDYKWAQTRVGHALHLYLETYTATRPGEAITVIPNGRVTVTYTNLETDAGTLVFRIGHSNVGGRAGLNLNEDIEIPFGPGTASTTAQIQGVPVPSAIPVAGTRINTYPEPPTGTTLPPSTPRPTSPGVTIPTNPVR